MGNITYSFKIKTINIITYINFHIFPGAQLQPPYAN